MTNENDPNQTPPPPGAARLGQVLDAYGADPEHWPEAERAALRELASPAPAAPVASQLDALLDAVPDVAMSADLVGRVLASAPRAAASRRGWARFSIWPWMPVWRPATALAFSALLGIALGAATGPPVADDLPGSGTVIEIETEIETEIGTEIGTEIEIEWELAFAPAGVEMVRFIVEDM